MRHPQRAAQGLCRVGRKRVVAHARGAEREEVHRCRHARNLPHRQLHRAERRQGAAQGVAHYGDGRVLPMLRQQLPHMLEHKGAQRAGVVRVEKAAVQAAPGRAFPGQIEVRLPGLQVGDPVGEAPLVGAPEHDDDGVLIEQIAGVGQQLLLLVVDHGGRLEARDAPAAGAVPCRDVLRLALCDGRQLGEQQRLVVVDVCGVGVGAGSYGRRCLGVRQGGGGELLQEQQARRRRPTLRTLLCAIDGQQLLALGLLPRHVHTASGAP
mmetsp:Transcript_34729/g.87539  ORF Transcript_34729/g.87539 Transcript_34729/m.87539 type:complete len:266 (+) Transcript_34729:325-1122(+)